MGLGGKGWQQNGVFLYRASATSWAIRKFCVPMVSERNSKVHSSLEKDLSAPVIHFFHHLFFSDFATFCPFSFSLCPSCEPPAMIASVLQTSLSRSAVFPFVSTSPGWKQRRIPVAQTMGSLSDLLTPCSHGWAVIRIALFAPILQNTQYILSIGGFYHYDSKYIYFQWQGDNCK